MSSVSELPDVIEIIDTCKGPVTIYSLTKLEEAEQSNISRLPYSIRVLLEALLRNSDGRSVTDEDALALSRWPQAANTNNDIPFIPSRVILQDFTGVPAVVDLAAMRSALERLGGDPSILNPVIPADLVIDHSVQVDYFGQADALELNESKEFARNKERYAMLRWAQNAFDNFRVIPPGRGIVHQVNLEYLAQVVHLKKQGNKQIGYPDTLVGTDSHTTMINGLGVLGWGVGGIEAEAVMLGQPYYMPVPDVVGFELVGRLKDDITATDMVLAIVQQLRKHGVVGKFVEFFGSGLSSLSLPDRATVANMAPEYGATMGFFPVDGETLNYLKLTGRAQSHIEFVKAYTQKQKLFYTDEGPQPEYSATLKLDLSTVGPSLAGPKRPQDRISLGSLGTSFHDALKKFHSHNSDVNKEPNENLQKSTWTEEGGFEQGVHGHLSSSGSDHEPLEGNDRLANGAVIIAAITSCTNTSNPSVLLGAGMLARNAVERGLRVPPWVKTSMAPGSRVVTDYLKASGLMPYLEQLGFHIVGYGCTTCIGNSGPIPDKVAAQVEDNNLVAAAVLSGNRNFEGRINPVVKANYLASPPLVIAYALTGTVDIDLTKDPVGTDNNGQPVYLKDIWPDSSELAKLIQTHVDPEMFNAQYRDIFKGTEQWNELKVPQGKLYEWESNSTYIREPPFFQDLSDEIADMNDISDARVLAMLEDSITTDHISPAGAIPAEGPAGIYLQKNDVEVKDFNSFGSRRGNHKVMMRGTFGNIRLRNKLADGKEGGWTRYMPSGEVIPLYDAAMLYQENNIPLIVIAGKEYGTGSSRDWAAKGTFLLGVKVVIAESYERIHRSNLVGMGVLPLQFKPGENAKKLKLNGGELYDFVDISSLKPGGELLVHAKGSDGNKIEFKVDVRLNSTVEMDYYRNGGILHKFIRTKLG